MRAEHPAIPIRLGTANDVPRWSILCVCGHRGHLRERLSVALADHDWHRQIHAAQWLEKSA